MIRKFFLVTLVACYVGLIRAVSNAAEGDACVDGPDENTLLTGIHRASSRKVQLPRARILCGAALMVLLRTARWSTGGTHFAPNMVRLSTFTTGTTSITTTAAANYDSRAGMGCHFGGSPVSLCALRSDGEAPLLRVHTARNL